MRHLKKGRKLKRERNKRKALLKSLAENLVLKGKIKTTEAKAKELRPFIEKKITKAKKGDLSAYRYLRKFFSQKVCQKLIKEIVPLLKEKESGYTRIIKARPRKGDGAKMAIIEIITK